MPGVHLKSQEFMDRMPGSPANSLPNSRNNSLRAGAAFFAAIPEVSSGQDTKKLGPKFAREMHQYGENCFTGAVAKKYLLDAGIPADKVEAVFEDAALLGEYKDQIASAVLAWAKEREATMFTHAFQPLGSEGVRAGSTGQVHNAMFRPGKDGPYWCFSGDDLIQGETDGSSFQNGGLRATHTAAAYTVIDPSSPIFLRDDTIFIPTVLAAFTGEALDEKLPLLRSMQAVDREGRRLLKHLGHTSASKVFPNIGLEQEFFLVPRSAYFKRPDLQLTGRTIMGKSSARGQEMCDHYMAAPNEKALACMREIQHECFKVGIPMQTRHKEVAPNQYECAPFFGLASGQIDNNLLFMQIAEEVAARHGLACLFAEKPFQGINGSGKHNNFSLGTYENVNLFNAKHMAKHCTVQDSFAIIMAATIAAIHKHGDLMRMATATPGNDFRLGAMEAPPAIVSTYLGESLTAYLDAFRKGQPAKPYVAASKALDLGINSIPAVNVPSEDRNRTSPFPYGGHRFEFRAVGSSQNVSMVNTVLCSILASEFSALSSKIEAGKSPSDVAKATLNDHWQIIFNGNGYGADWPVEAAKRGIPNHASCVDAIAALGTDKSLALFEGLKDPKGVSVMTKAETKCREAVMFDKYCSVVEMEALCMVDMIRQHVYPSALKAASLNINAGADKLKAGAATILDKLHAMEKATEGQSRAKVARQLRLETMAEIRGLCDEAEAIIPPEMWTIATYKDLLFLDSHHGHGSIAGDGAATELS